jgi:hypothetical protein
MELANQFVIKKLFLAKQGRDIGYILTILRYLVHIAVFNITQRFHYRSKSNGASIFKLVDSKSQ